MNRLRRGLLLLVILLVASPAWADSPSDEEVEEVWSATILGDLKFMSDRHADNDVGAFFDQYEFTPNKSSSVPFEIGVHELSYDRFGPGQTPQLQLRFASPTSNLGISGSQIEDPFLNQRAELYKRRAGLDLDFEYWRFRTEALRLFPNTQGRQFEDLTDDDDRFYRDRTGLYSEIRLRPAQMSSASTDAAKWFAPEFSLRGGFEERDGSRQLRFLQEASNRWGAIEKPMDEEATKAGGGILIAPGGLLTATFDVDYHRFRHDSSTLLDRELGAGFLQDDDAVNFIPDTDRLTGSVMLKSQIGERAVLEGGFQIARVEQVDDFTPLQRTAGLDDNRLLFYSMNAAGDLSVTDRLSVNAFIKYDQRKNKIQRDTSLFNPTDNQVQFSPFLKRWDRVYAGAEAVYALHRRNHVALGARYEWIDRDLKFGLPTNLIVPETNVRVAETTRMWTVYGRTNLRPYKGLGVSGEVGYRGAPDTGYITDLDRYVYGKLRASYRIPIEQTVLVSTFVRGGSGRNRDFSVTSGMGATPDGDSRKVEFDRKDITWGATVTSYPLDDLSVYASFFQSYSEQSYDLILSDLQRYWQTAVDIDFFEDGSPDSENQQLSFVLGAHLFISDQTDGSFSYSFTRAEVDYDRGNAGDNLRLIADERSIDADIHGLHLEVGHWLREGLRLQAGYRVRWFDDSAPRPNGTGSVVRPITSSSTQHSVTFGVTLTSDIVARDE